MRISETRQRQLASLAEYNQQRRQYKEEQEHTKRAREAKEAGRLYDKRTERTYDIGEKIPAADPNASVPCGVKRKAEVGEENTHQHRKLKTNTLDMSPSRETKEHLEDLKARRQEGQSYQGTALQGESRRVLAEKPKNPYAGLKAAKRGPTSKAAPPKIRVPRRAGTGIEGRQDGSRNETMPKKTTVAKEAATPSKKRKAGDDSEEVSAAVKDVAKEATSTLYKRIKVEAKVKAEAVADTKPIESGGSMSLGKKRKAADALEDDTAQGVVHGDDTPSAKKRRREDWPVVKTESLEEKMTTPSGGKKAESVKDAEAPSPSGPAVSPATSITPKAPMKRMPWMNSASGWGQSSTITTEVVTVKKSTMKGGSSEKRRRV